MKKIISLAVLLLFSLLYAQDIHIPEDYTTLKEYYIEAVELYLEAEKDNSVLIDKVEETTKKLKEAVEQLESNNVTLEENKVTISDQKELIEELSLAIIDLQSNIKYKSYRHGFYFNYSTNVLLEDSYSIGYTGLVFNTASFSIGFDIPIKLRLGISYYFN